MGSVQAESESVLQSTQSPLKVVQSRVMGEAAYGAGSPGRRFICRSCVG